MYYIEIENLVANALIERLEKFNKRSITFSALDSYCNAVVANLKEGKKDVITIFSRESTEMFFHDYTDFFDVSEDAITLKDNIELKKLKEIFRINLALDVLLAFSCDKAIEVLKTAA